MNSLLAQVERSICERKLLVRSQKLLVAVSGGLDSMVLLDVLRQLAQANRWELTVAHFNHRLRGRQSDGDEAFVRKRAERFGLKCVTARGNTKTCQKKLKISLEMAARELRHKFLKATARRLRIRTIAVAHHADDQVELFFVRLMRGAAPGGLAGMKWKGLSPYDARQTLIRPLLDQPKLLLMHYAQERKIAFREDRSNSESNILRNRIRNDLLPNLRKHYQAQINTIILRLMDTLSADAAFLRTTAERWLAGNGIEEELEFESLPLAVQRECLALQLIHLEVDPSYSLIESLRSRPDTRVSIRSGLDLYRTRQGRIRRALGINDAFLTRERQIALSKAQGRVNFGGIHLTWKLSSQVPSVSIRQVGLQQETFDAGKVGSKFVLRHWRRGDRFQPIGMTRSIKLQDLFTNLKIPKELRRHLVLAATAKGDIFWVEGMRISERFKLDNRTTRVLGWLWRRI